jgi:hypothetical protein
MDHLPVASELLRQCRVIRAELADLFTRTRELREELDRIQRNEIRGASPPRPPRCEPASA